MKTRFIPAITTLLAAAVVSIINIIDKTEITKGLRMLLIAIVVFYLLGTVAKVILNRSLHTKNDQEVEEAVDQNLSSDDTMKVVDSGTNDKIDE